MNLDGREFNIKIDATHSDNITEIYSSHITNHLAILTQEGRELSQVHIFEWKQNHEILELELEYSTKEQDKKKHFWGGFDDDGCVFFRMEQSNVPESWKFLKWYFAKNRPLSEKDAGYFPEMIGKSRKDWIWRNQITTTKSMLNGKGDVIQARVGTCHSRVDGELYAIVDYEDASVGQISKISINQDTGAPILHNNAEFVTLTWTSSKLPNDETGDIPLGELKDFLFIQEKKILFHINENGTSKLLFADTESPEDAYQINLDQVEEACGGKVWINVMKSSHDNKTIVLEIMNYNVRSHLWLYHIEANVFSRFTTPADVFDITTVSSTFPTSLANYGQISMQYLKVEQLNKKSSKGTVILFHGGPAIQTHVGRYFDRVVTLVKAGYTVIAPNPAGSLGRGGKHINLDRGEHRIQQFNAQVIPFVEKFINYRPVHLLGGSYAGWLITKILNHEIARKIESAVVRNGIVDWRIFTKNTSHYRKRHRAWEYVGEDSFESEKASGVLDQLSPGHELKCSNILFFTGKKDRRVPSFSTYKFLEECGFSHSEIINIRTEYPTEGHKIKKYKNRIEIMEKTLELFLN